MIRLHPTPEQATYFCKAAGTARFVYNWALARWWQHKTECPGEACGVMALKREFNAIKREQFPWVFEVTKSVCEYAFTNLGKAFTNYYNCKNGKCKGATVGFPRFNGQVFPLKQDLFCVWSRKPGCDAGGSHVEVRRLWRSP